MSTRARFACLVLVMAGLFLSPPGAAAAGPTSELWIEGAGGAHRFSVEVAATPAERQRGLMFRESLPAASGMLFLVEVPTVPHMWMANTAIPLDMVFIDQEGRVAEVAEDTTPFSRAIISPAHPVRGILEINAGTARRLGIRPGDRVRHPAFGTGR